MKKTIASTKSSLVSNKIRQKAVVGKQVQKQLAPAPAKKSSRKYANLKVAELTVAQLKELEARLRLLREEFKNSLKEKADQFNIAAHNESLIKGDDAEVAEKQRVNNAALQEIEFIKTRIQLVSRALSKINAGVYGICEETEEPIGYERLNIVPWAKYAVHVQEVRERKMREFRGNKTRAEL
jgi:DnaK suppressor protein